MYPPTHKSKKFSGKVFVRWPVENVEENAKEINYVNICIKELKLSFQTRLILFISCPY